MQLLDSDWPANILAGSHFRAQETRALSPDGVCTLARARLGTRLALHGKNASHSQPAMLLKPFMHLINFCYLLLQPCMHVTHALQHAKQKVVLC